ncbi:MAG: DALR domain-containing protein, partial [Halobacteriaceae archaeon]
IECSAMSTTHLGETFDIHVAGQDLVFPHNENEVAQSEAATGDRFARYWLHTGLLETEGEKMSSSLMNYFAVEDAVAEFGTNVLRTFFLSAVYSARQTYSEAAIAEAEERFDRLERGYDAAVEAADSADAYATVADDDLRAAVETARREFEAAMNDDLNTREALAALGDLAGAVHQHVDDSAEYDYRGLGDAIEAFEQLGEGVFGLSFGGEPEGDARLAEGLVELVLEVRADERERGNYDRAD